MRSYNVVSIIIWERWEHLHPQFLTAEYFEFLYESSRPLGQPMARARIGGVIVESMVTSKFEPEDKSPEVGKKQENHHS
jgi:hypothetical protein